jgi:glycosyltransferase involved in cell wall biosynthesis
MNNNKKGKILLTHRFFYPDSPTYAHILEHMRVTLQKEGYQVDVLSTQPSYKLSDKKKTKRFIEKSNNGSTIYRLPIFKLKSRKIEKILNFFWFPFASFFFQLFSKRYDIVTVATTPPVLYAFSVALVSKIRRRKLIYHNMDIHPEIGRLSGEFKNRFIFNVLQWMDNFTCKTASRIIVLSSDMRETLIKRNQKFKDKINIINNYDVSSHNKVVENNFLGQDKKIKVVFTGNIGRFQNLETFILALIEYGCPKNFELIFVGEGVALNYLKELSQSFENCVRFIPHQPMEVARKIIAEADMGIVSLEENIIKYAYPSKTMTYLSEGTPILVCVDEGSELSQFVKQEAVGISVIPSNLKEIHNIFMALSTRDLSFDRKHIKRVFDKSFSQEIFDKKLTNLVKNVMEKK